MKLRDAGKTLIAIEHNFEVIQSADWIIDPGLESGAGGGESVAQGTRQTIAKVEESDSGRYLRRMLCR